MVNNIGKTNQSLSTNLGGSTTTLTSNDINLISGMLGVGCLVFDRAGTLGVITTFTDQNSFVITTYALSINVSQILHLGY